LEKDNYMLEYQHKTVSLFRIPLVNAKWCLDSRRDNLTSTILIMYSSCSFLFMKGAHESVLTCAAGLSMEH